jgi:hypothetical protein
VIYFMSNNRYRCPNHIKALMKSHVFAHFPNEPGFYPNRTKRQLLRDVYDHQLHRKTYSIPTEVHNKRLGVKYTVPFKSKNLMMEYVLIKLEFNKCFLIHTRKFFHIFDTNIMKNIKI